MTNTRISLYILILCACLFRIRTEQASTLLSFGDFNPLKIVGEVISGVTSPMTDNVKQALIEAADSMCDRLDKSVDKIFALVAYQEQKITDDVKDIINLFSQRVEDMFKVAVATALQFADRTIEEIKEKIIDATFDRITEIEDKTMKDADAIVTKLVNAINSAICEVEVVRDDISKAISDGLPNPYEECRRELGYGMTPLFNLKNYELYMLRRCQLLKPLTVDTPLVEIAFIYGEMQTLTVRMNCLGRGSSILNDLYTKDFYEFGARYEIWKPYVHGTYYAPPDDSPAPITPSMIILPIIAFVILVGVAAVIAVKVRACRRRKLYPSLLGNPPNKSAELNQFVGRHEITSYVQDLQ